MVQSPPKEAVRIPKPLDLASPIAGLRHSNDFPRKEVISIQPGDVVVMSCDVKLEADAHTACQVSLQRMFPRNDCMVLDGGMTLEVYREQVQECGDPCVMCEEKPCKCQCNEGSNND